MGCIRNQWGIGACFLCVCFGIGDECLQDWMEQARDPMSGMRQRMRRGPSSACCFQWFFGSASSKNSKIDSGCFALAILPVAMKKGFHERKESLPLLANNYPSLSSRGVRWLGGRWLAGSLVASLAQKAKGKKRGVRKGRINQSVVSWCFSEHWSVEETRARHEAWLQEYRTDRFQALAGPEKYANLCHLRNTGGRSPFHQGFQ